MSNDYFEYGDTLIPGSVAKAEEVAGEFEAVQSAFDLLPNPRPDGLGFLESFLVPDASEDGQVATWGQLKGLEATAQQASSSANAANNNIQNVLLPDFTTKYNAFTGIYADVETWRNETEGFKNDAQRWASEDEDTEVENGEFSAKHWALKAAQLTSGARAYIGGWSAASGNLPIASPQPTDAGKFWRITASGTLPGVGAVVVEDELSIKQDLSYEVLPTNSSVQSVNGQTGSVNLDKDDVGLGSVPNYPATDSLDDGSSAKFSTAKAANDLKVLVEGAQSTANSAVSAAGNAQSTADTANSTAGNALSAAGNAQNTADQALSSANTALSNAATANNAASNAQDTADTAEGKADTAQNTADAALNNAANAQVTANTANSTANNALTAAGNASIQAGNANNAAGQAQLAADAAQDTADTAVNLANAAQQTADAAEPAQDAALQYQAQTAALNDLATQFEALLQAYNARWNEVGDFDFNTNVNLNGNDLNGVQTINFPGSSGNGFISRSGGVMTMKNAAGRIDIDASSGNVVNFRIDGVTRMRLNADGSLDISGTARFNQGAL